MTPLGRYVAEEIATDHVDGLLSRREALRRLGLLGMGAAIDYVQRIRRWPPRMVKHLQAFLQLRDEAAGDAPP